MKTKTSVILVFVLFLLLATGLIITEGKDSLKIRRHQNNLIQLLGNLRSELSYDPESHDFGDKYEGEVDSTTFEIWNSGCCTCTLIYSLTEDCGWVDVHPTEGTSNCEHDTIFVDINTTGLVPGPYICDILILSNWGDGVFTVTVNILSEDFTNITVYEAWDLLNDTSNGIQIPIDVRTDEEWYTGLFIDPSYPEIPRHYCLALLQDETGLEEFLSLYDGEDVVLYCTNGSRSFLATMILVDANFTGTIYNMLGGITAWEEAGLPIRNNTPPEAPSIKGAHTKVKTRIDFAKKFKFTTIDPDGDNIYLYINWGDGDTTGWIGLYASGEEVTRNHTWSKMGIYTVMAKAKDIYGAESDWATLKVTMPRNRAITSSFLSFLQNFLQQHQNLFPLLRLLLLRY